MKVLKQIPHPDFGITLFWWNQKYILKFEKGNFEQTFKVSELEISSENEVLELIENEQFTRNIQKRFLEMENDLLDILNGDYMA